MKKLILLFVLLIAGFALQAQTVTVPAMKAGFTYSYVQTAYDISAATVRNFIFPAAQAYPATQDFVVELDTVPGTATQHSTISVALYGQKSAIAGDWTAIGSAKTWYNTTLDTIIVISNATATRYENYKAVYTGSNTSGAKSRITKQYLKLYLE